GRDDRRSDDRAGAERQAGTPPCQGHQHDEADGRDERPHRDAGQQLGGAGRPAPQLVAPDTEEGVLGPLAPHGVGAQDVQGGHQAERSGPQGDETQGEAQRPGITVRASVGTPQDRGRGHRRGSAMPTRTANSAAWVRSASRSLASTFDTWVLTVLSDTNSSAASWRLVRPRPSPASTSRSRAVRRSRSGWSAPRGGSGGSSTSPASRAMTPAAASGASMGSPRWTARMARSSAAGSASLSR